MYGFKDWISPDTSLLSLATRGERDLCLLLRWRSDGEVDRPCLDLEDPPSAASLPDLLSLFSLGTSFSEPLSLCVALSSPLELCLSFSLLTLTFSVPLSTSALFNLFVRGEGDLDFPRLGDLVWFAGLSLGGDIALCELLWRGGDFSLRGGLLLRGELRPLTGDSEWVDALRPIGDTEHTRLVWNKTCNTVSANQKSTKIPNYQFQLMHKAWNISSIPLRPIYCRRENIRKIS